MQHGHILKKLILLLYWGFLAPVAEFEKKIHFLSGALVALLFSGVEPFVQFWLRALSETIV